MAEWLIEEGIGEDRALLIHNDEVLAARVDWKNSLTAGHIMQAKLVSRQSGSSRGTAQSPSGENILVSRLPRDATEGSMITIEITRPALSDGSRSKLAQARPSKEQPRPAPSLAENLGGRITPRFPAGQWEDVWSDAWSGTVEFTGGALHFSPTPAMTLVDVDGTLPPRDLALAAVDPLAEAISRFGLAGSIGIDFPTLQAKDDRKAVDGALAVALADWDHERTAMNGFGFVQIVARLEAPSLLHLLHHSRAQAAAKMVLRRAEAVEEAGTVQITAHPAVTARLGDTEIAALQRRLGRDVVIEADAGLALDSGFAQALQS